VAFGASEAAAAVPTGSTADSAAGAATAEWFRGAALCLTVPPRGAVLQSVGATVPLADATYVLPAAALHLFLLVAPFFALHGDGGLLRDAAAGAKVCVVAALAYALTWAWGEALFAWLCQRPWAARVVGWVFPRSDAKSKAVSWLITKNWSSPIVKHFVDRKKGRNAAKPERRGLSLHGAALLLAGPVVAVVATGDAAVQPTVWAAACNVHLWVMLCVALGPPVSVTVNWD
jgi:hypothetical protein